MVLETGKGEARGNDLELGSVAAEAGEESWGAAGDDAAALGQAGGAAGGEGGG